MEHRQQIKRTLPPTPISKGNAANDRTAAVTGQIDVRGEMDIMDNDSTLGGTNSYLEHPDVLFNEKHNAKI